MPTKINIAGVQSPELIKCLVCARELKKLYPTEISFDENVDCQVFFPTQWEYYFKALQNKNKGVFYEHKGNMIVFLNKVDYIGGPESFLEWALQEFIYIDNTSSFIYTKMSNDQYMKAVNFTEGRSYVFLDLKYRGSAKDE